MYDFVFNFKNNNLLRLSFNKLAQEIFSIDFEKWYSLNAWNDSYIPFSYVLKGKIIANVSANIQKMTVNSLTCNAIQIGTVMTHPDYRNQGLASSLLKTCLNYFKASTDIFFLFPDENAVSLYEKNGFSLYNDYLYSAKLYNQAQENNLKKLDPDNHSDLNLIKQTITENFCLSSLFSMSDDISIKLWHYIYHLKNYIWYSEKLHSIIVCRIDNNSLKIYDFLSPENNQNAFLEMIYNFSFDSVLLFFTPDMLDQNLLTYDLNEPIMTLSDSVKLPDIFCFPYTSRA